MSVQRCKFFQPGEAKVINMMHRREGQSEDVLIICTLCNWYPLHICGPIVKPTF